MRILKISDGYITNSSSDSAVIIIAIRKGKDLKELIEAWGVSIEFLDLPSDFLNFEENMEYIKDYEIEVDHLLDEYEILINYICTESWGDGEYYKLDDKEFNSLLSIVDCIKKHGEPNIHLLYFRESSMY